MVAPDQAQQDLPAIHVEEKTLHDGVFCELLTVRGRRSVTANVQGLVVDDDFGQAKTEMASPDAVLLGWLRALVAS